MEGRAGRGVREVFIERKQRNEQEGQLEYRKGKRGEKIKAAGESELLDQEDELEA